MKKILLPAVLLCINGVFAQEKPKAFSTASAPALASPQKGAAILPVKSKFDVSFYGFVKAHAMYESGSTYANEFSLFAVSDSSQDENFRITSKETRFGFNIKAGEQVKAVIEMDFFGLSEEVGGKAGMTASPRMRHAYIDVKANDKFSFLFGQYWHLTPLEFPASNAPAAFGSAGCLWMRLPQIRATYKIDDTAEAALALVRANVKATDAEGTHSGRPGVEAYVSKKIEKSKLTLSGAVSRWQNPSDKSQYADVYLVDLGYNIPYDIFTLNGQIWWGQNLYDFLAGGLNIGYEDNPVKAVGGFASLKVQPWKKTWFAFIYGIDNPENKNVAVDKVIKNTRAAVNLTSVIFGNVEAAFEAGPITTWYKTASGTDERQVMHYSFSAKVPF